MLYWISRPCITPEWQESRPTSHRMMQQKVPSVDDVDIKERVFGECDGQINDGQRREENKVNTGTNGI